jgi:hypothetical protein
MYYAKVKVEQTSCSLAVATQDGRIAMEILEYIILNEDDALFLVRVTKSDEENITRYLKLIDEHPSTIFIQILEKTPTNLDFLAVIRDVTGIKAFEESYCFVKPPIVVENGCKVYNLIVPDISFLTQAYTKLKNVGNWKLLEVKRIVNKKPVLTEAQKQVLKIAWKMGYFSDKRRTTIRDISRVLGIAKSTAHKHLKDSISKLVERYMAEKIAEKDLLEMEITQK